MSAPQRSAAKAATLEGVEILKTLLASDPSIPRLTCYDETTGGRTDLSAITLDNWASKIANMLHDEFDVEPGDNVWIDLPPIWQAACIILGCERAGVRVDANEPLVVFTSVGKLSEWEETQPDAYLAVVTDDPFGRGVVECGGEIPPGVVDFGPEVRFHPDAYLGSGPESEDSPVIGDESANCLLALAEASARELGLDDKARVLSHGWIDPKTTQLKAVLWAKSVLSAWSVGGAAVIVRGGDSERLEQIATAEKATILQV